jgi:hypothetical protein
MRVRDAKLHNIMADSKDPKEVAWLGEIPLLLQLTMATTTP